MAIVSRKNKDGSYTYQVRERDINGKQVSFSFNKKGDAKAFEAQLKVNKNKNVPLASPGKKITLNEFWDNWFTRSNTATDGWKYSQRQMYRDYIKPYIGNLSLSNIKPPHISDILIKMEKLGRAEQTRKHVYNLLHKIFEDCIEDYNYLTENPVKSKFLPKVIIKDSEYLDYDEVKLLLLNVRGKKYGLGIWIQLFLGLRIGEVIYLKWEHILELECFTYVEPTEEKKNGLLIIPKGRTGTRLRSLRNSFIILKKKKKKDEVNGCSHQSLTIKITLAAKLIVII